MLVCVCVGGNGEFNSTVAMACAYLAVAKVAFSSVRS